MDLIKNKKNISIVLIILSILSSIYLYVLPLFSVPTIISGPKLLNNFLLLPDSDTEQNLDSKGSSSSGTNSSSNSQSKNTLLLPDTGNKDESVSNKDSNNVNPSMPVTLTPNSTPTINSSIKPTTPPTPTEKPPIYNPPSSPDVTVDFASSLSVNSMSGSLHGLDGNIPVDSLVIPLKIKFWRGLYGDWVDVYKRLNGMGAKMEFVVTSYWTAHEGGNVYPYDDNYVKWESDMHILANAVKSQNAKVMWDIWNEPDTDKSWSGTKTQFFETYCRASQILKSELGDDAIVGGPSLANGYSKAWVKQWLTEFLNYAKSYQGGCQVNFLSWHELGLSSDIPSIANNLNDARSSFLLNPSYSSLNIKQIQINEFGSASNQFQPGDIAGYLDALEKGKADYAAPACWNNDLNNQTNCFQQLDGLVSLSDQKKRSTWWLYKFYADGVNSRVFSSNRSTGIAVLASRASSISNQAQIIVGYYGNTQKDATVQMYLKNLTSIVGLKGKTHIKVTDLGGGLDTISPVNIFKEEDIDIYNVNWSLYVLSGMKLHHAYLLTIS